MLTEDDVNWLDLFYPQLTVNTDRTEIQGELFFAGAFNEESNQFLVLRNDEENTIGGFVLEGSYKLKIKQREVNNPISSKLPAIIFENGQVDLVAERHFNRADTSACVCGPVEEEKYLTQGFKFKTYFEQFVIPFLYAQKYYDLNNKTWPWGEYGHGSIGILASYFLVGDPINIPIILEKLSEDGHWKGTVKSLILQKSHVKGHIVCWCGKNKILRNCHVETWEGINKLKKDMKENNIKI